MSIFSMAVGSKV